MALGSDLINAVLQARAQQRISGVGGSPRGGTTYLGLPTVEKMDMSKVTANVDIGAWAEALERFGLLPPHPRERRAMAADAAAIFWNSDEETQNRIINDPSHQAFMFKWYKAGSPHVTTDPQTGKYVFARPNVVAHTTPQQRANVSLYGKDIGTSANAIMAGLAGDKARGAFIEGRPPTEVELLHKRGWFDKVIQSKIQSQEAEAVKDRAAAQSTLALTPGKAMLDEAHAQYYRSLANASRNEAEKQQLIADRQVRVKAVDDMLRTYRETKKKLLQNLTDPLRTNDMKGAELVGMQGNALSTLEGLISAGEEHVSPNIASVAGDFIRAGTELANIPKSVYAKGFGTHLLFGASASDPTEHWENIFLRSYEAHNQLNKVLAKTPYTNMLAQSIITQLNLLNKLNLHNPNIAMRVMPSYLELKEQVAKAEERAKTDKSIDLSGLSTNVFAKFEREKGLTPRYFEIIRRNIR